MLIKVSALKTVVDDQLVFLEMEPKDKADTYWADVAIRTEDIADFYSLSPKKIVITFYDERPKLVVRDTLENIMEIINKHDYCEEE